MKFRLHNITSIVPTFLGSRGPSGLEVEAHPASPIDLLNELRELIGETAILQAIMDDGPEYRKRVRDIVAKDIRS